MKDLRTVELEKYPFSHLGQTSMCPPQVWVLVLYCRPTSLRVLHSVFTVWRTISMSRCASPRSQLYYSQLHFSQPPCLGSLIKRNQKGWLGESTLLCAYFPVLCLPMFPCRGLAFQATTSKLIANILPICCCFEIFSEQFIFRIHFTDVLVDASCFIQDTGLDAY